MLGRRAVVATVGVLALCATGCSGGTPQAGAPSSTPSSSPAPASSSAPPNTATQASQEQRLTPAQQAGQRVIYSYPGKTVPASLLAHVKAGEVAGVIFFKENIPSRAQLTAAIDKLNAANAQSPVKQPLLLLTDQEGGQIRRLPGAPESSAKEDGAAADPVAAARRSGTEAAQNLAGAGMNANAAPVLDVYRKPGDFADRTERSYSRDPRAVAADAGAFADAQQAGGVAATAKHFPGLGSATATANTDEEPVTLDVPLETLRSVDEAPYPSLIKAGVRMVMSSWAIYPALDPKRPAGLSPAVVRKELRERLGFGGVTITDALEAKSLRQFGDSGSRGLLAAQAGQDLILASGRSVSQGEQVATALKNGLTSGDLDSADNAAALDRITGLRSGLGH
ncbi:glycoside hydrolase family 3 N-terminal domain-containing protein [Sciscionella marina]|uniref:glycoside hydrolase family 3 N-terminal domain-containing protein n=1 Tax=Sciscionella marina TaxID=508770 RepID=UPI0009FB98FE|nr:glycoside hydrolase family 3 N-terminal domain-containing protein [Sciscionella marina]